MIKDLTDQKQILEQQNKQLTTTINDLQDRNLKYKQENIKLLAVIDKNSSELALLQRNNSTNFDLVKTIEDCKRQIFNLTQEKKRVTELLGMNEQPEDVRKLQSELVKAQKLNETLL